MEPIQKDLLETMETEALREKRALEEACKKQIQEIQRAAEEEIKALQEQEFRIVAQQLLLEQTKQLRKAELRVRNSILIAKHKLVERVLSDVEEEIMTLKDNKTLYHKLFQKMLFDTLKEVDGNAVIKLHPSDKDLCQELIQEQGHQYRIESDQDIVGGVTVVDLNEHCTIHNTLQHRTAIIRERAIENVAKTLFGKPS